jgi:hypothetical protein
MFDHKTTLSSRGTAQLDPEVAETWRQAAEAIMEDMFFEPLADTPGVIEVPPPGAIFCRAEYSGTHSGVMALAAEGPVARSLASNFLGLEEADPTEEQQAATLCELTNIFCGCLLSQLHPDGRFRIGSPYISNAAAAGQGPWMRIALDRGILAISLLPETDV